MRVVGVCPWCGLEVELRDAKDSESFTGVELEAHYEAAHPAELAAWTAEHGEWALPFVPSEIRRP